MGTFSLVEIKLMFWLDNQKLGVERVIVLAIVNQLGIEGFAALNLSFFYIGS